MASLLEVFAIQVLNKDSDATEELKVEKPPKNFQKPGLELKVNVESHYAHS